MNLKIVLLFHVHSGHSLHVRRFCTFYFSFYLATTEAALDYLCSGKVKMENTEPVQKVCHRVVREYLDPSKNITLYLHLMKTLPSIVMGK